MLSIMQEEAEKHGDTVEMVYTNDLTVKPCTGCMACRKKEKCVLAEDDSQRVLKMMQQADAIIIALLIFSSVMGIGSYLIRQVSPQDHWIWPFGIIPLPMEPAHYLQYVMMFVIGILARRFAWLEKMGNTIGALSLTIGCLLAIGIYLRDGGAWNAFVTEWFGIYESLLCVFICFGLLWLFREFGNWDSKFWLWCAAQSYGAYIFHLLLMIVLQYATDGLWMGAFGKFMFIGIITTICSFVLTWLVRMIPGVKKVL